MCLDAVSVAWHALTALAYVDASTWAQVCFCVQDERFPAEHQAFGALGFLRS